MLAMDLARIAGDRDLDLADSAQHLGETRRKRLGALLVQTDGLPYVYDNNESGIGITQTSQGNVVEDNQARGNVQDGVRVVSEAAETTVRANTLGENGRYGVYVDVDGDVDIAGNMIFANQSGIMLKGSAIVPDGTNEIFDNREAAIRTD